jgi:nucleoside-diphosphate-sugar epimerase
VLDHLNSRPQAPARVVVVGATGFVGGAVAARLEAEGIPVARLGREDVDLGAPNARTTLTKLLRPSDAVVAVAARAPCKNADMLVQNMIIARAMVGALSDARVSHVINISSDAVYADAAAPLTEESCAAPGTLHGAMHLAREVMFSCEISAPLTILRPSLLYGALDTHNGYGPNLFRRLAEKGEHIVLYGQGEELRDHVYIDDAAWIVMQALLLRSKGVLNIATGEVHSFREIAEKVVALSGRAIEIRYSPRNGPMPHNGYRPFDIAACRAAFPNFRYTPLQEGLANAGSAKGRT